MITRVSSQVLTLEYLNRPQVFWNWIYFSFLLLHLLAIDLSPCVLGPMEGSALGVAGESSSGGTALVIFCLLLD